MQNPQTHFSRDILCQAGSPMENLWGLLEQNLLHVNAFPDAHLPLLKYWRTNKNEPN